MNFSSISPQTWVIVAGAAFALLAGAGLYLRHYNSMPARIQRALKKISHDSLQDIYLPDGMGGHIHLDVLLLTGKGLLVLDIKDVPGTLFGAEKMTEWVVMNGRRRHTFRNPLPGLHDRLAVVRSLARDVHAEGWLVFTEHGEFTKGMPRETVMLHDLVNVVGPAGEEFPQAFDATWREIKAQVARAAEETKPGYRET